MIKLIILFGVFVYVSCRNYEGIVDYYERMVTEGIANAHTYVKPVDASAHKPKYGNKVNDFGVYDFIVVGSGAAGSIVAARLSENANWNVLLLEAGQNETEFTDIPGMYFYLDGSDYNWAYTSVPQNASCLGMIDRKCPYPRGKSIGGTTMLNGLVYTRGNRLDFDNWGKENPGWSYEEVLPHFIRQENSHIDGDPGYHGVGGPLNVEYHAEYSPQFYAFLDANVELGRKIADYNGVQELGVARAQMNKINGSRLSTSRAYLRPVACRKNLRISINSYVTKVVIEKKRAVGVLFTRNGRNYFARATKEVIVSAGTLATPQILMLSGIGPEVELKKHSIGVIQNLAVGRNLHDHTTFYGINIRTNYSDPIKSTREYVKEYLRGTGPYSIPGNNQGVGYFQTHFTNIEGYPDIELMMIPSNRTNSYYQKFMAFTDETYNALLEVIDNTRTFIMYVVLLQPKSIGTVTLKSANPFDYPEIDSRFLTDPRDIESIYAGIQLVQEIVNTTAFKRFNASFEVARLPACSRFEYLSKDYWFCFIRHLTMNLYHPVGTCKMGPNPHRGGVVDARLNVHGIKGLRVADGSVLPFSLAAHPAAAIMLVGERAAEFIKHDYNAPKYS